MLVYIRSAAFVIDVTQKLVLQQSKNATAKYTETLSPLPSIQFPLVAMISAIQNVLELLIVKDQQNSPTVTSPPWSFMISDHIDHSLRMKWKHCTLEVFFIHLSPVCTITTNCYIQSWWVGIMFLLPSVWWQELQLLRTHLWLDW